MDEILKAEEQINSWTNEQRLEKLPRLIALKEYGLLNAQDKKSELDSRVKAKGAEIFSQVESETILKTVGKEEVEKNKYANDAARKAETQKRLKSREDYKNIIKDIIALDKKQRVDQIVRDLMSRKFRAAEWSAKPR